MNIRIYITIIKNVYGLCSSLKLIRIRSFLRVKRLGFRLIFIQLVGDVMIGIKRMFAFIIKMIRMITIKIESFLLTMLLLLSKEMWLLILLILLTFVKVSIKTVF